MEQLSFEGSKLIINPQNGASITKWTCFKAREEVMLINNRDFNLFESSLLFPFPNRLASGKYNYEGMSFHFDENDPGKPNALHGFIYNVAFDLVEKLDNSIRFRYEYDGTLEAYPFPFTFEVNYILKKNELEIQVDIQNTGSQTMPCGFGWHPYFDLELTNEPCRLKMPKTSLIEVNENLIPTGAESYNRDFQDFTSVFAKELDSCYRLEKIEDRNSVFLNYPQLGTLEVWQDHNFPFVQVYKPDERAMAIEPMSCGIDAFNTQQGIKKIAAEQSWSLKMGLKLF
jgi:aldose 1-epimerase